MIRLIPKKGWFDPRCCCGAVDSARALGHHKLAEAFLDFGTRVQYSVFECVMDDDAFTRLTARLTGLVSDEDSIRIYSLCGKCERVTVVMGTGKVTKDEDVYIL